jgi:hypothetical protein|nr:MAG TPA_asm: hypothetical protein [Caudoviricetes sp.]
MIMWEIICWVVIILAVAGIVLEIMEEEEDV